MITQDQPPVSTHTSAQTTSEPQSATGPGASSFPSSRYYKRYVRRQSLWQVIVSPFGVLSMAVILMVALLSFGIGASAANGAYGTPSTASNSSSSATNTGSTQPTPAASIPDATRSYGNQILPYTIDHDGAKHFTMTAEQVMWEVVKGVRVLAWTINGTVPGPMIRVTAGDHVRITLINHFPKPTALHWHGLEVPSNQDGVPGVGMKPVMPGQTYVYDFRVTDQDVGTHWYHSHYDDQEQVGAGMYGAFIVDPRPGTPQYQQQQALHINAEYTEFIGTLPGGWYVINGKSFPDTQPILVKHGQTVHLRLIGADTMMIHPMHIHGHTYTVIAEDGHMLPPAARYQKDTIQVAPGETYDATFYAWAAPGSVYPLHCHILSHLMNPNQSGDEMGGLITLIKYAS
jgi:FtsP/CotA-like multicopper oxidase with cupredoxin domain